MGTETTIKSADAEPRTDSVDLDTLKRGALIRFVKESNNNDTGDVTKGDEESENQVESNRRC